MRSDNDLRNQSGHGAVETSSSDLTNQSDRGSEETRSSDLRNQSGRGSVETSDFERVEIHNAFDGVIRYNIVYERK